MTDNEIITDDEILSAWDFLKMVAINIGSVPIGKSEVVAINGLLNRQMYEIEKLTVELQAMRGAANSYKMHYKEARAEAVKEFAERLTDKAELVRVNAFDSKWAISQDDIDNLVKEFTEGSGNDGRG